jgi:hypothetical protein
MQLFLKNNRPLLYFFSLITWVLSSCIDSPEPLREIKEPAGKIEVALGENYRQKVYFNLETKTSVKTVSPHGWDLAFECGPNKYGILLNYANGTPFGYVVKDQNFDAVNSASLANLPKIYDGNTGEIANTVVGIWGKIEIGQQPESYKITYVIDRGIDGNTGEPLGTKKFQITQFSLDSNTYFIKYANLDNSDYREATIKKDPLYNFVYFSFLQHTIVDQEPPKTNWDLVFTKYSTRVDNLIQYSVVGVLNNPSMNLSVAVDSNNLNFNSSFSSDFLANLKFNTNQDAIGYSWKTYPYTSNPTAGTYKIETSRMYFIKKNNTQLYKLKFYEYYKTIGTRQVSGYPTFLLENITL